MCERTAPTGIFEMSEGLFPLTGNISSIIFAPYREVGLRTKLGILFMMRLASENDKGRRG